MQELQKQYKPMSLLIDLEKSGSTAKLNIPPLDTTTLKILSNSESKIYKFAIPYKTRDSYTESGTWTTVGDIAIWKLEVQAIGSQSLNFGFKDVFLPPDTKLFIYTLDQSEAIVFTEANNKPHKEIWTPVFESENVIIEINVPIELKNYLHFDLASINQGYRSIKSSAIAKSGSCNIDVSCLAGDEWRDEIRSVARYTISGSGLCTGTLVNNTHLDNTPYFLTANHCGITLANDSSLVFYWDYQTSLCGGLPDGSLMETQNGATLVASRSGTIGSDFALLELDTIPSINANVIYAGWDNTDISPSSAVAIHHPNGDEKRISYDNDTLIITDEGGTTPVANADYLGVLAWDGGTTEPGSSGSVIFNQNHHIVGTLTSGLAACAGTIDNDEPDWYGRFAKHWTGGGTNDTRLSNWLDPATGGAATSLDSNGTICNRPAATVSIGSNPAISNESVNFSTIASGGSGGYTYQWDFNNDGSIDSTDANTNFIYTSSYEGIVSLNITDSAGCTKSIVRAMIVNAAGNSNNNNNSGGSDNSSVSSSGGGGNSSFFFLNFILLLMLRKRFFRSSL